MREERGERKRERRERETGGKESDSEKNVESMHD